MATLTSSGNKAVDLDSIAAGEAQKNMDAPTAAVTSAAKSAEADASKPLLAAEPDSRAVATPKTDKPGAGGDASTKPGEKASDAAGDSAPPDEPPLNDKQRVVLEKLKGLHAKHQEQEKEYRKEWNMLKLKYFRLLRPLYDQRLELLENPEATAESDILALPEFWLTALKNNNTINQAIEAHDIPILRFLKNISFEWVDEQEQMSFRFKFHFAANPYFTNDILTKTYELEEDPDVVESVLTRTEGTPINWKEGMNVSRKIVTRRQRNRKTLQFRTVTLEVPRESFLNIFESREIPDDAKLEAMTAEEVTELENTLELEYEIGCTIRDKIIPHAVGWYLGVEVDDDMDDTDESFNEDDDDEEGDSDNDDNEGADESARH